MHHNQEVLVSEPHTDREVLAVPSECRGHESHYLIRPQGLEYGVSSAAMLGGVTVEQLRAAVDRYSARKTTVPGSYAHQHYLATGHTLSFGCCRGTAA